MLSPCRTSVSSSYRSSIAAVKAQCVPLSQLRPGRGSSSSSSSSSSAASTSRTCLPSNPLRKYNTSTKRPEDRKGRSLDFDHIAPAVNAPLTPKAAKTVEEAQAWFRNAFPELPLPDKIAMTMITHESWDHGMNSDHNRRLSFLGRRAMKFYISLFLSKYSPDGNMLSSKNRSPSEVVNELLHTSKLGDSVGQKLKLAEVMRWTPAINNSQKGPKETGLYKVRGVMVEALVGAIYHQHGAQAARAFFSSRILPNLGTFSRKEAEILEGAIESEAKEGLAVLRNLVSGRSSAVPLRRVEQDLDTGHTAREVQSSSRKSDSTATSHPNGTRRRTASDPDSLLEKGASENAPPASERHPIA